MTAIVELSSGQMIDLSGCLALNTSADSQYQLFLKGFQKPIDLSEGQVTNFLVETWNIIKTSNSALY
jgi:hypothetical protein